MLMKGYLKKGLSFYSAPGVTRQKCRNGDGEIEERHYEILKGRRMKPHRHRRIGRKGKRKICL
jgi:hypothetical protein